MGEREGVVTVVTVNQAGAKGFSRSGLATPTLGAW
jgi:hypothetical protein